MATVSSTATYVELRMTMVDHFGEMVNKVFTFSSTPDATALAKFVDDYENTTNAKITKAQVVSVREVSGLTVTGRPADVLERKVSDELIITFGKPDTANPSKTISRNVAINAPKAALISAGGNPIYTGTAAPTGTTPADSLRRVIEFYVSYAMRKPNEVLPWEEGGWLITGDGGQFVTLPSVVDSNPLT